MALMHRPVNVARVINVSPPTNANWTAHGSKRKRFHVTFAPEQKARNIATNRNRNVNNDWDAMMQQNVELFYEKYEIQDKNTAALEDFTRFCTLGEGAFGRVMMLQNHGDKIFYAMKILKKEKVIEMQQESNCLNEKRVMQALTNPFIVNLAYHMKNNSYCFMVMEFITGGEMFDLLQDNGGPLSLEDVQFYMSNVILGFEYLQECNIVYRDLKPENVLLAGDGYAKIADFGLSKRVDGMTYTLCGTLEYLAPEVIAGAGYYKNFDWWTVGVLTYELAAGFPPFLGADEIEMFALIQAFDYEIPDWFDDEISDLVDGFLQPDSNRLGSRQGVDEIKDHPFFADVDWVATYHKGVPPPFVPEHKDPTNPRNFKKRVTEEPIRVSAHDLYTEIFFDF